MVGKRADIKFANGRRVNNSAVRKHLAQQLELLGPEIKKYISRRGLEVSITIEQRPWRLELVWRRKNQKALGPLWQKRIRDFLGSMLTADSNLFLFAQPSRLHNYTTELRIEDVSVFVTHDHDDDDRRDPHFHNYRG